MKRQRTNCFAAELRACRMKPAGSFLHHKELFTTLHEEINQLSEKFPEAHYNATVHIFSSLPGTSVRGYNKGG